MKSNFKIKKYIILIIVIVMAFSIIGCKKSYNEEKKFVEDFLENYKNESESVIDYLSNKISKDEKISFEGFQGILASNIEYKINDAEKNEEEDCITVTVTITNLDFKENFDGVIEELKSSKNEVTGDDIVKKLEEKLNSDKAITKKFECAVNVIKENEKLKIEFNDELSNALLGGFNEYINELPTIIENKE